VGARKTKLDLEAAAAFLETVPAGRWTSYGDVAIAAGRQRNAAQGIASWIASSWHRVAHVHRVLNANGEINEAWAPAGPSLPANASQVAELLRREGVRFEHGRAESSQRWRASNVPNR
jgi:alkylated DNA nucleotide flippase Atl1